jgi:uncharacterized delta-60 repeat protein
MRKLRLVLILALLASGVITSAAAARGRLDPSFGQDGVVEVRPTLPPLWQNQYIRDMAATRGGDSFVLFERSCFAQQGCTTTNSLFRYLPDGSLDPSFGGPGGSYDLPLEGEGLVTLAVDSRGRPLLAQATNSRVVVRRLTASGEPDPGFGQGGAVAFPCRCEYNATELVPGPEGTVTVALPTSQFAPETGAGYGKSGTTTTLVRLRADGSRDRSFGTRGGVSFGLKGVEPFVASAATKSGALYLGGIGCCGSQIPAYLIRVSAKGRLDTRFKRATQRSLRALDFLDSFEDSVDAVLVRPGGKIDVLGSAEFSKGFVLRLKPNGHLQRKFGDGGMRMLPSPVASATFGSDGTTMAVSDENLNGTGTLMRLLAGGRLDPAFGPEGVQVPGTGSGLSVVSQVGRKALVLDLGLHECRGYCAAEPRLVRFLEGPPPKRR